MPRRSKQSLDLADVFQTVSSNLAEQQASLNQADSYNHDHGDNMVEIFNVINEAVSAKSGKKPAQQLAYASKLLSQRSQSGSAKLYADGLTRAAQQYKGKAVTPDNIAVLLQSLMGGPAQPPQQAGVPADLLSGLLGGAGGGQASAPQQSNLPADLLSGLLGGAGGGQASAPQQPDLPADLLSGLLGGAGSGQTGVPQQASAPSDLLGSLLGGAGSGQTGSSQGGLDLGDLLNAGMAFMSSQQQGDNTLQSIIKAFVAATQVGQKGYRAQSGEVVANSIVQSVRPYRKP